jgi:hypothetical protein
MTDTKLFRQVLCSERLPKEDGSYIVDVKSSRFNSLSWAKTYWFDRFGNSYEPTENEWWLEEVELPSEGDKQTIVKDWYNKQSIMSNYPAEPSSFMAGFNKAIELIKGGKS